MITFDKSALPANVAVIATTATVAVWDWKYALTFLAGAVLGSLRFG